MTAVNPLTVIPADLKPGDTMAYKIVAVIGHNNDWAAYCGPTESSDEEIAQHGAKISEKAASGLFYAAAASGLRYRR